MKVRNLLIITSLLATGLVACTPRDAAVTERGKQRMFEKGASGPTAGFSTSADGSKLPHCTRDPWSELRLPASKDALIASGQMVLDIKSGNHNCYQVGMVINIQEGGNGAAVRGKVQVTKLEILNRSDLTEGLAKKAGEESLATLIERLDATKKPDHGPLVNIMHFKVIERPAGGAGGSAPARDKAESLDLLEDGQILPDCDPSRAWSWLDVNPYYSLSALRGESVQMDFKLGRICLQVGSEIEVYLPEGDNRKAHFVYRARVIAIQQRDVYHLLAPLGHIEELSSRPAPFRLSDEDIEAETRLRFPEDKGYVFDPLIHARALAYDSYLQEVAKPAGGLQETNKPLVIIRWQSVPEEEGVQ